MPLIELTSPVSPKEDIRNASISLCEPTLSPSVVPAFEEFVSMCNKHLGFVVPIPTFPSDLIIQCELSHWWLRMGYTLELARSFLSELGYSLFLMTEDGLTEIRFELPEVLFVTANIMALPQQTSFEKLYQDEIEKEAL